MTIWKFELKDTDTQTIIMPKDAEILCLQLQRGKPCIWASFEEPEIFTEARVFNTYATGQQFSQGKYVGTYQPGPSLVLHVFEVEK